EALELTRALHQAGADAAVILIELAEFCHFVTRAKIAPGATEDPTVSEIERERGREFADKLTLGVLTRAWQILLKGMEDVKDSPRPLASAEMALIRLAYASDLPTPEEALRKLAETTDYAPRHAPPLPPAGGSPRRRARLSRQGRPPRRRGSRGSRTSSLWRGRSATSSSSRLSNATCGWIGSSRAASPFRWSKGLRPASRKRWRNACRNGPASAGWWRARRARRRRHCVRPNPPAKPNGRRALRRIRWCAKCSNASKARASSRCARRKPPPRRPRRPQSRTRTSATPIPSRSTTIFERGEAAMDIMGMMKKAQEVQAKLQEAQEELGRVEVEGTSGGGMVRIAMTAKGELKGVQIDPSLMTPSDKEMLEDLIMAAFADAKGKADRAAAEKMQSLTAGLTLPPGMKLP